MNYKEHRDRSEDPGLQEVTEMISLLQKLGFGAVDLTSEEEIDKVYAQLEEYQKQIHGEPLSPEQLQHKIAACDVELARLEAEIAQYEQAKAGPATYRS